MLLSITKDFVEWTRRRTLRTLPFPFFTLSLYFFLFHPFFSFPIFYPFFFLFISFFPFSSLLYITRTLPPLNNNRGVVVIVAGGIDNGDRRRMGQKVRWTVRKMEGRKQQERKEGQGRGFLMWQSFRTLHLLFVATIKNHFSLSPVKIEIFIEPIEWITVLLSRVSPIIRKRREATLNFSFIIGIIGLRDFRYLKNLVKISVATSRRFGYYAIFFVLHDRWVF